MHGTEHRNRKRRTFRLSAPPGSGFPNLRINASWLAAASSSDQDRQLVTAFPSPATTPALTNTIPGSMVPACHFAASQLASPPGPPFCSTTEPGSPRSPAASKLLARCRSACCIDWLPSRSPLPFGVFGPSGSKRSTGSAACRPAFQIRPISLRSPLPFLFQVWRRITVPGPLRLQRLAVPQTSWNLLHYDPELLRRQRFFVLASPKSSRSISIVSNRLREYHSDYPVDKTRVGKTVLGGRRPAAAY